MKPSDSDDKLRERLHELRDEEAAGAPSFEAVRRGAPRTPSAGSEKSAGWYWRPAWAVAALLLVALGGGWWVTSHRDAVETSRESISEARLIDAVTADLSTEDDWTTATDGLLADASGVVAAPSVEQLTREIAALLQP